MSDTYFAYWGKASPDTHIEDAYHLLPFHCLDVAACGQALIRLPRFSLHALAQALGWTVPQINAVFVFFLALHDLGKFARSFQGLVPDLSPDLVAADKSKPYVMRHDTLGWMLWRQDLAGQDSALPLPEIGQEFWQVWMRCVTGHHGKPPQENEGGGLLPLDVSAHFLRADRRAAREFVAALLQLLPGQFPVPDKQHVQVLRRHAWRLAGLSVLADWLGSNPSFFPYRSKPLALPDYWQYAQQRAESAVAGAGLQSPSVRTCTKPLALFDYLETPTPLQTYAATVELEDGPQLFLLEDVTGAGKTEAALVLAQRLMQQGGGKGVYFALPSMATANQMYARVGAVYRQLYEDAAAASLMLAHGARELVESFRQSIMQAAPECDDFSPSAEDASATVQCSAWLADNRKKALLADVGVGTLDQALLAVMPARHQSLRLLGLGHKVLLVDEVHAYDAYMLSLLRRLLTAHARQGGSAILLSATLPVKIRQGLVTAYRQGLEASEPILLEDLRYPLAVRAGRSLSLHACATRTQLRRTVQVCLLDDEDSAVERICAEVRAGRCVAWIRNTVEDARRAHGVVSARCPDDAILLFHSRYVMGDRLDIEDRVLACFGKASGPAERVGRVLIGTQVLEQSLDFDVDVMVTDLAPIDLIIQRAGRLQRHARQVDGQIATDSIERRPVPVLYVLSPALVDMPEADWYARRFPKACHVYPNVGVLWLSARALQRAGCIVTPGEAGQEGAVRMLVEAVYGDDTEPIPETLVKASQIQLGKDLAMRSQANFNALDLEKGYCIDSSALWYEDFQVPTRLGDETLTLYLARGCNGELRPFYDAGVSPWPQSAVRIHARYARALAPEWLQRFSGALERLRAGERLLREPAFVLPMVEEAGHWVGHVLDERGAPLLMRYRQDIGLVWDRS